MRYLLITALCCTAQILFAQSNMIIDGQLSGKEAIGKKIVLSFTGFNKPTIDSAIIGADGRFQLQATVSSPAMMMLVLKDVKDKQGLYNPAISFFAENSKITVRGIYDSLVNELGFLAVYYEDLSPSTTVAGSKSHDLYLDFYNAFSGLNKQKDAAFRKYVAYLNPGKGKTKGPIEEGIAITRQVDAMDKLRKDFAMKYILANPASEILAYIANKTLMKTMTAAEIEQVMAKFTGMKNKGRLTEEFLKNASIAKKTAVGTDLIDFALSDINGKQHKLSDYVGKGKFVLVEFWASWCGPCRADIPHLKEVYKIFNARGFDIVSVSLDEKYDAWVKAMKDEGITEMWPQLIEPNAFKSDLVSTYRINGIPACLLFDPNGKLVTYNMRGSFMDDMLIRLYGDHFAKNNVSK